ncbi:MAG: hypothetical protein Q8J89_01795 [Caulobacter sp.]|nr:hypothetical protein [Caulobacter sp.]
MSRHAILLVVCALTVGSAGSGARAGEVACWFENGAVVVPASIGGVAGDWLLDPSAPRTQLHDTRAAMEGLGDGFAAAGRLADLALPPVPVTVADLDGRAPGFVTPVAGVIGADILAAFVIDLRFEPCRVRLYAGRAPGVRGGAVLRLETVGGVPAVRAAISDDRQARAGLFAVDWSSRAAVRLTGARITPAVEGLDPARRDLAPARLRALSLDGMLYEEPSAALATDLDPALAGALGLDLWSRWSLRLDIAGGRLTLLPK